MFELSIFLGSFILTYFGVRWFRAWTLKRGVLDHPNERSSHTVATPRGGGLVLALVILAAYIVGAQLLAFGISWGFLAGALIIVAISWLDDVYSVSFVWRILAHSMAAALLIYDAGWLSAIVLIDAADPVAVGQYGIVPTFLWVIWLVNSYNFMDGIDGIAGTQAVTAGTGWLLFGLITGSPVAYLLGGTVLFAALAFLLHNWPPARIFMGDAGSAFLGFVFASIPILVRDPRAPDTGIPALLAILLVWLFVFDSVFTFLRRLINGEKVWQAHRQHLYQRLVISGYSHLRTTLIYGTISLSIVMIATLTVDRPAQIPAYWSFAAATSGSAVLLLLCWKRGCLFGKTETNANA